MYRTLLVPAAATALVAILACGGGTSTAPADPWAAMPTETLSRDHIPYLIVVAEEGMVAPSSGIGLLRSDHRTEHPRALSGVWTAVATDDRYVYSLQIDGKMFRRPEVTTKELDRLFESVPRYLDSSGSYTGMAASPDRLFVLASVAAESTVWSMANTPVNDGSGPADVQVVAQVPFRAIGLHVDRAGALYTLPAPEGAAELPTLWRWDPTLQLGTETALSIPIPIDSNASPRDLMPSLRAQMFADEGPWIGVVVQTEVDMGNPWTLPTIDERVFKVHGDTGEVRIVGSKRLTWP